jgi:dTDP-4-amino-4,6-dideoxygalactose transaminase
MIAFENRASYILYNIIMQTDSKKKIIVPANVCPIVIATLLKAKKNIELVDINENNYHINTSKIIDMVSNSVESYDSILFVRTYGADLDFNSFFNDLKNINNEILIIDDKCLAIPELEPDFKKNVDATLFSTGYVKYVELGFGGYAFIKDDYPYSRVSLSYEDTDHEQLTNHFREVINGKKDFEYKDTNWLNGNFPKIQLNEYFQIVANQLEKVHSHKRKINKIYSENLPREIMMGDLYNNWRFNILVDNKEVLLDKIFKNHMFASSHYSPINRFLKKTGFEVSERVYSKVVNLFNDFRYTEDMAYKTARIIQNNL